MDAPRRMLCEPKHETMRPYLASQPIPRIRAGGINQREEGLPDTGTARRRLRPSQRCMMRTRNSNARPLSGKRSDLVLQHVTAGHSSSGGAGLWKRCGARTRRRFSQPQVIKGSAQPHGDPKCAALCWLLSRRHAGVEAWRRGGEACREAIPGLTAGRLQRPRASPHSAKGGSFCGL
jgi:hypothetical protein